MDVFFSLFLKKKKKKKKKKKQQDFKISAVMTFKIAMSGREGVGWADGRLASGIVQGLPFG